MTWLHLIILAVFLLGMLAERVRDGHRARRRLRRFHREGAVSFGSERQLRASRLELNQSLINRRAS
ncbi:MAG: hypothetical protein ACTHU0_16280, partial [Kofleriaceae bacterium]